ncbi:MAG: 2-oxoacid:acceptor oxidoreductase family protein [Bacillota bacterium]
MSKGMLPTVTDEFGFYEMRFESIGGLGAHLAGQILAEAGVLGQGLNGAHFSSYGSEKKGTPVKSFVRLCAPDREVRSAAPITRPHLVAVFHEALIRTENVTAGLRPDGIILVNTTRTPEEMKAKLKLESGTVAVIDALKIAVEEKTRVNTAMLGAVARIADFIDPDIVRDAIKHTFEHKYPQLVAANLRTFDRGYEELKMVEFKAAPGVEPKPFVKPGPLYGYLDAPIGGIIVNPGNSALKDLSSSRQGFLPEFNREKCTDCAQCDLVCPDFCFTWTPGQDKRGRPAMVLQGIDYQYCKGCLKCVEACPFGALVAARETEDYAESHRVPRNLAVHA